VRLGRARLVLFGAWLRGDSSKARVFKLVPRPAAFTRRAARLRLPHDTDDRECVDGSRDGPGRGPTAKSQMAQRLGDDSQQLRQTGRRESGGD
jgi:hypothetical protein